MVQPADSYRLTDPWAADAQPPTKRQGPAPRDRASNATPAASPQRDPYLGATPQGGQPPDVDVNALPAEHVDIRAFLQAASVACPAVIAPPPDAPTAAQTKLDAYREAFSGPYRVRGEQVSSAAQFRMPGGYNDRAAGFYRKPDGTGDIREDRDPARALFAICRQANAPNPRSCLLGCPKAEDLVSVTQALIDAGKLRDEPGDVSTRIKTMQWRWGIGVGCTDYAAFAALNASGKSPADLPAGNRPSPGTDYFASVETNPNVRRVGVAAATTGDVFCLERWNGGSPQRAVVYANEPCDANRLLSLAVNNGPAAKAFLRGGPVHEIQIDSSWTAGSLGSSLGGIRRDVWLYNESSRGWARLGPDIQSDSSQTFQVTAGPGGGRLRGIYRFQ